MHFFFTENSQALFLPEVNRIISHTYTTTYKFIKKKKLQKCSAIEGRGMNEDI
jgi:hypothetical protein